MRHILGISGGKDSAALAIHLSRQTDWRYFANILAAANLPEEARRVRAAEKPPQMEYFFTDTGKELPEVYSYLDALENHLNSPIIRLTPFKDGVDTHISPFDHLLASQFRGLLPSRRQRWCTLRMKIYPIERFVGNAPTVNYVGIRADESARVKISAKPNITAVYPFVQDDIVRNDVFRILEETAGIPKYYEWRSRSGCFFCFFQRKNEWLGLRQRHPDLFKQAMEYEENTYDPATGRMYTWNDNFSLRDLDAMASKESSPTQRKKENADMKPIGEKSSCCKTPKMTIRTTTLAPFARYDRRCSLSKNHHSGVR